MEQVTKIFLEFLKEHQEELKEIGTEVSKAIIREIVKRAFEKLDKKKKR